MDDFTQPLLLAVRLALGSLFLTSALGKLRDRPGFVRGLTNYQLLSPGLVLPASVVLPLGELTIAALLLIGMAVPMAGLAAALLLIGFSTAVVVNLRRGRTITCHCHGLLGSTPISWGLVARNGVLLLLTMPLIGGVWWPVAQAEWSFTMLSVSVLLAASTLLAAQMIGQIMDVIVRTRALGMRRK